MKNHCRVNLKNTPTQKLRHLRNAKIFFANFCSFVYKTTVSGNANFKNEFCNCIDCTNVEKLTKYCVLNERGKCGAKIFSHFTDIDIFVLGYFNWNHHVYVL